MYVADTANKSNTSLYMVDPRGLVVYEYDMSNVPIGPQTDTSSVLKPPIIQPVPGSHPQEGHGAHSRHPPRPV